MEVELEPSVALSKGRLATRGSESAEACIAQ